MPPLQLDLRESRRGAEGRQREGRSAQETTMMFMKQSSLAALSRVVTRRFEAALIRRVSDKFMKEQCRLDDKGPFFAGNTPDNLSRLVKSRGGSMMGGMPWRMKRHAPAARGDPDRIRTCDLQFRKLPLYPAELRDHSGRALVAGFRFLCIPLLGLAALWLAQTSPAEAQFALSRPAHRKTRCRAKCSGSRQMARSR